MFTEQDRFVETAVKFAADCCELPVVFELFKKKEGTDIINMKTFWKSSERQQQFKSAFYSLVVFEFRVVEMDGITPLRSASYSDHCR